MSDARRSSIPPCPGAAPAGPAARPTAAAVVAALTALAALASPTPSAAQASGEDGRLTVDRLLDWERVSGPRISPDGDRILFTRSHVDAQNDTWASEIWIMDADGDRKRFLAEGSSPRWSPDGDRIAYVAQGDDDRPQVFVKWLGEEGGPTQVTRLEEAPREIRWSPDGERISFLKHVPDVRGWNVDVPAPPEGAQWTEGPKVVDRIHYRADGMGWMDQGWTHLFTVPATGGTPRQLTEGEWHVGARFDGLPFGGGYDWTPDGSTIVFDGWGALGEGDPDRNYRTSHIYALDVETKEIRRLTDEPGTWTGPEVGPDGRRVAFTGYAETDLTTGRPTCGSRRSRAVRSGSCRATSTGRSRTSTGRPTGEASSSPSRTRARGTCGSPPPTAAAPGSSPRGRRWRASPRSRRTAWRWASSPPPGVPARSSGTVCPASRASSVSPT